MKIFFETPLKLSKIAVALSLTSLVGLVSCATLEPQYGTKSGALSKERSSDQKIVHTYYLVGNISQANNTEEQEHLEAFKQMLSQESDKNSTLVLLGNNTKKGMPSTSSKKRKKAEESLASQLGLMESNKGTTVFINGESDWQGSYEGIKNLDKYLVERTGNKKTLLPRKVCGLERLKINDETVLIVIDSQWYIENWDNHPNINEDCDIKTREDFFEEVRGEINKNQNKVVVLAMYHPVYSNGNHGGKFSVHDHLFPIGNNIPLPIIGSVYNYTRQMSGINPQDLQSKKYNELNKRIRTIAQMYTNVVIASGHEHNLQYIDRGGVKQIISGAMSNLTPARAVVEGDFSAGVFGYSKLEIREDKSAKLSFYGYKEGGYTSLYSTVMLDNFGGGKENRDIDNKELEQQTAQASVYPKQWTEKSKFYRFLWGEHYRNVYGTPITAPVADLTTLKGGLTPTISGGGNQSMSLRLVDKEGKEYVMRGVRKSVSRFAQTAVFKDHYVMNAFDNTWTERFIYDFYTTSHPYTPFILDGLADKIGMYHTNPELYYVPKQSVLGRFNDNYGDELYMIEERPSSGYEDEVSFGNVSNIISTTDVIAKLRKDEKYEVDQTAYMRARIFDMLIGDWDRHGDQWRWSEFTEGDKVIYRPIPRDRDQAFAKIDGALLSLIKKLPPLRHMQNYTEDFANPRWINKTAFPLDQYLLKSTSLEDWLREAKDIVEKLDDEALDEAFSKLPQEVQTKEVEEIKRIFKARRNKIDAFLPKYYKQLREYVILSGTDKKEVFDIERLAEGNVRVKQYRAKKTGEELVFDKVYNATETKEIWVYGLNDEDTFKVSGDEKAKIKIRLIGGKNQDTFLVDNSSKVIVYDYADKKNEVKMEGANGRTVLTNKYDINNFNYERVPLNLNMLLPNIGFNPEDGVKLGFLYSSTRSKFIQDPYTAKHVLKGFYSFNTKGLEAEYKGYFPNATNDWMFTIGGRATSPNFAVNYYGLGNETYYFDKEKGKDYKRVRIESYSVSPGYRYEGKQGASFEANLEYDALKVKHQTDRYIADDINGVDAKVFDFQQYGGLKVEYNYEQYNYPANPTVGFGFNSKLGWRMNLEETKQNFAYLDLKASFLHFIDRGERLVLATNFTYQTRFNENYDFYHAATIGGNANLRGFRPERFTGKTSFVQTTDLRFNAGQFTAGFLPMSYGFYGGFDYGRVWQPGESSNKWHNSYGAGLWISAVEQATLHCSFFNSVDGGRFVFGLGFGF